MMEAGLGLTILGSGTSTGVPVLGCRCPVCRSEDPRNRRTRCSALLQWAGYNVLIDTSTDFRQQGLREDLDRIDAVLFTHTHADHVHGIDDLRTLNTTPDGMIPVFCPTGTAGAIRRIFSYIFHDGEDAGYRPRLTIQAVDGPFDLFGQTVTPIPLVHGSGEAFGYRVGSLAYLTDCSQVPDSSLPLLEGLGLLVIDALRFREHASHFNIAGAIELSRRLGAARTLLTHLSHDVDHTEHSTHLPSGVEFAYDGQKLWLPLDG